MITHFSKTSLVQLIRSGLENVPMVSFYAKTRGWPFVIAWLHRISAMLMVLYIWFHIYTLSFLVTPDAYDAQMKLFGSFPFPLAAFPIACPAGESLGTEYRSRVSLNRRFKLLLCFNIVEERCPFFFVIDRN